MLIIYCIILGLLIGLGVPEYSKFLQYFDVIFLRLLNLVMPFMIFTMVLKSVFYIRKNIFKDNSMKLVIMYYSFGTFFSILIGFAAAYYIEIGVGQDISNLIKSSDYNNEFNEVVNKGVNLVDLIPSNLIGVLYHRDLMKLFIIGCLLGIVLNTSKYQNDILSFIDKVHNFSLEVVNYIMILVPYALFSLVIRLSIDRFISLGVLSKLALLFVVLYIVRYVILLLEIYFIGGISPLPFIKKSFRYQSVAFISMSSKGTLPIANEDMKSMGISKGSRQYAVSIGSMLNAIGFGLDLTATIVFILNVYGVVIGFNDFLMIIFLSFIGIIIALGIPGGTIVALTVVLKFFGIPYEILSIVLIIERIADMFCTTLIVSGIVGYTLVIDGYKGNLNQSKYYDN